VRLRLLCASQRLQLPACWVCSCVALHRSTASEQRPAARLTLGCSISFLLLLQ
jgi:hypothetical protein